MVEKIMDYLLNIESYFQLRLKLQSGFTPEEESALKAQKTFVSDLILMIDRGEIILQV